MAVVERWPLVEVPLNLSIYLIFIILSRFILLSFYDLN